MSLEDKFEAIIVDVAANGYAICDNFLSLEEVINLKKRLVSRYEDGSFKEAGIGKQSEKQISSLIRGDEILWLECDSVDISERTILDKNLAFISYLNRTCFLGIKSSEIHFAKYGVGKFYKRHRDSFQTQKGRILSIIYYLNIDWILEDGGNLIIYSTNNNIETSVSIAPLSGRMVCFESDKLDHEVTEVFKERFSITGWLLNHV